MRVRRGRRKSNCEIWKNLRRKCPWWQAKEFKHCATWFRWDWQYRTHLSYNRGGESTENTWGILGRLYHIFQMKWSICTIIRICYGNWKRPTLMVLSSPIPIPPSQHIYSPILRPPVRQIPLYLTSQTLKALYNNVSKKEKDRSKTSEKWHHQQTSEKRHRQPFV